MTDKDWMLDEKDIGDIHQETHETLQTLSPLFTAEELSDMEEYEVEQQKLIAQARKLVEWIADRSFGAQCCPDNPMMLHLPYEDYRTLRKDVGLLES